MKKNNRSEALVSEKPFVLSVKVVIRDDTGRCLLIKRSMSSKWSPGKWELPGGKIDPGESFDEALLREVDEETGLKISLQRVAGSAEFELETKKVACIVMEGHIESGQFQLSSEHDDYAWVPARELPKMDLAEPFLVFAKKYIKAHTEI
ncbi:MAG: hypothetical protein A7316_08555 [Candidatus Altiarchaeales archaeon WOR_SM1_86-2]|nr:MAG: hypothetical protein A7316_08555 [Candidatus Altiarchaeales archaeon WOR_SM1_86-2]ODS41066.1 MAG: hypothetical protein A7315_07040 [Candidatus Altiarchaeales archaeon WOR_SM1_79]